ncbi:MutS-related protein [Bradyrhizobium sp. BR 1432]|uniref:MutS-related protein n=1 Tax=Bradyrhizobium sp. BR 1432 TaxID=3447966 RepID=UPI003EE6BA78
MSYPRPQPPLTAESDGRERHPSAPDIVPSVLFDRPEDSTAAPESAAPEFFADLNLDQLVAAITAGFEEYAIKPVFHVPLQRVEAIEYRHEVFRDLEDPALLDNIRHFAERMRDARIHKALSAKLYDRFHKQMWFLHAIEIYCNAVDQLATDLTRSQMKSRALLSIRDYLTGYIAQDNFVALRDEAKSISDQLSQVRYGIVIREASFTVKNLQDEPDYSAEVEATFARFKQGAATDYRSKFNDAPEDMNHIEAKVLQLVARLNPEPFARLLAFCARQVEFLDKAIVGFDRDVQFYLAYLKQTTRLEQAGLRLCLPEVSDNSKQVHCREGFDLALALKHVGEQKPVVCNDFDLTGRERLIVVSGPNQGGKTTFARMVGQLHYLASLGCPVPARGAKLYLVDQIFTHFEREEKVENLRGKLEDDLVRIRSILKRVTRRSIVILNEIFTSTTIRDETFLSQKVMTKLAAMDVLGVWVTFVDELSTFGPETVSMVSTVVPDQPAVRTFKIERRTADGLAYAMAIAQKYGLTHQRVKERIKP